MEIPGSCVSYVYCDGIAGCGSKQQASEASHSIHSDLIRNAGWKVTTKNLVGSQYRLENGSGLL